MIISDLQHIESATETEVRGGCDCGYGEVAEFRSGRALPNIIGQTLPSNVASADASAQAFGTNTSTSTTTNTLVIQGQFSGSNSSSFAAAS